LKVCSILNTFLVSLVYKDQTENREMVYIKNATALEMIMLQHYKFYETMLISMVIE